LANRLGWIDLAVRMTSEVDSLTDFAAQVAGEGIERILVLGMGGSSLAPEVFQRTLGNAPSHPRLDVLDSTHPAAVAECLRGHPPEGTLYVVSSKSGTTLETLSFFRTFWAEAAARLRDPGSRFVAITDPGTPLAALAAERGFRGTFLADPEVGGRFSALSHFGLLPAALIGVDLDRLLAGAEGVAADLDAPLALGAAMGELAAAGRDKLTLGTDSALHGLPAWLEQLVAESLGKRGTGVVPVDGEPPLEVAAYGPDRFFVRLEIQEEPAAGPRLEALAAAGHPTARLALGEPYALGAEMLRWEVATAAAGVVLGVNPFDQPDVESAKRLARRAMAEPTSGLEAPALPTDDLETVDLDALLGAARPGDYVAIQAFLAPTAATRERLAGLRRRLLATGCATMVGFGPRFLHSTGQLHKGGPDNGLFVQLVDEPAADLPVPETDYGYARLIAAQALGDAQALVERGRRLLRLELRY
jgi:transaldolase/glucose-6-phosphate isomerase